MDLILKRQKATAHGVFGVLIRTDTGEQISVTLEHAYEDDEHFVPKVASGTYICRRHPPNRLPYETFELQDVPPFYGHSVLGILIHIGNFNKDSEGCILLGKSDSDTMICGSKVDFQAFMQLQQGVDSFTLVIE